MERKIRILPVELTLKIAAGEVIERPASILKELLENALDAGATSVRVELQKGGCAGIRIEDNGRGMSRDEAPLAFERFATSKIDAFDDLYHVASYGFRGEALPSIAAIAHIEMTTRTRDAMSGTRIIAEAGRIQEITEAGCPVGTTISVTRIFDNVPVRKKFLKSEATEQGYCLDVMQCAALADEKVKIDVVAGGRSLLAIPATSRPEERVALILGKEAMEQLLPVKGETDSGLCLRGFVSKPSLSRSSAKHIYCFVNRRFVKDHLVNHAVMTAYRNVLEAKRYPVAVLHLQIPAGAVDVNVHPAKMEVRFQSPREIYGLIVEAALHGLAGSSAIPALTEVPGQAMKSPRYQVRVEEALKRYHLHTGGAKLTFKTPPQTPARPFVPVTPFPPQQTVLPEMGASGVDNTSYETPEKIVFADLAYLGQASGTYLAFAGPDGLILIDQHAAHERILFEKLKESGKGKGIISQQLLMPEVMTLGARECDLITEFLPVFREVGLDVESFGDHSFIIKAVPAMIPDLDPVAMIRDIIDDSMGMDRSPHLNEKKDRLLAILSCRGAVKANHSLSPKEASALCRDMDETPFSATCPHGRPTYVAISRKELEKMFKRR
ncbi:MAG: DNA mismatch repair protein MutL [Syntrophus sp. SKADARSKE-3]|nr:DNA mismatch repair protein MutL [Syntrophus sp. SKADARSKE-3]